jgi:hypothetical protein
MDKAFTYQHRLKALVLALESFGNSLKIDLSSRDETGNFTKQSQPGYITFGYFRYGAREWGISTSRI